MHAGYSGTALWKKLGIGAKTRVQLLHAPDNYFELLGADISGQLAGKSGIPDLIHLFATSRKQMESTLGKLKKLYRQHPGLVIWVSWYKKSSGMPTDLTEDLIREYALRNGLVDVKVCAVSEQWSGLKLVVPLHLR